MGPRGRNGPLGANVVGERHALPRSCTTFSGGRAFTQVIRRQMEEVEANELRADLNERIRNLFGATGGSFSLQAFPAGAYEVDDTVGDGRPSLVLLHHDAFAINADPQGLPSQIEEIFKFKGTDRRLREFRNNLVFVVADERQVKNMNDRVRRRLALAKLKGTDRINQLASHQQEKVKEEYQKSPLQCAEAILHCYRHLFFPYNVPMAGSVEPITHAAIEVPNASDTQATVSYTSHGCSESTTSF